MATPIFEEEQFSFPAFPPNNEADHGHTHHFHEDGSLRRHPPDEYIDGNHLHVTTSYVDGPDHLSKGPRDESPFSPSSTREQASRLDDDLEVLRAERMVSHAEHSEAENGTHRSKSLLQRSRSRASEPVDDFDVGTTPIHEKAKVYQPPENPTTTFARVFKKIHSSSFLVRYFCYITPLVLILLIPTLLGLLVFKNATVGGVRLFWFGIWLEILWLTLWAGRIIAKCIPYPMGLVSSLFTNSSKKWKDLGRALEMPATLFFWWLAVEVSFLPTMKNHHLDHDKTTRGWEVTVNKIIVSIFVGVCLNFVEKIIIQLIAISFHLRTYADRIDINKFQISSLVKLYKYSREKIAMEDSAFEINEKTPSTGVRTPKVYIQKAQKNARHAFNVVGDLAGKVAGDFTGKAVKSSTHPNQVVIQLLSTTNGSQVLARRLYRTFVTEGSETVFSDDLRMAFDNDDEADAAFTMFDKDLNGDISMEELEAVCVEIGRERKAITASLKDLDSVVSKLDDVFFFIVFVITVLVFISLISTSAAGVLTSAGSAVLALSWLFSATAQEFLQSIIFVFVKHPFDVGDRVTIYGNTGSQLRGDDYFVKEISLLFTEFKKMEGHVVQAPNSYLNTLFILNQRRSGGLAEAVPVTVKFGTSLQQIESLRNRLLEFVSSEKREYQQKILTELTTIFEAYSITLNVVFFYKSNWQNELLRLQRRNKFICALMVSMEELGIEGPRMRLPGAAQEFPVFLNNAYPPPYQAPSSDPDHGPGPRSGSLSRDHNDPVHPSIQPHPSILRHRNSTSAARRRGESLSQMQKHVDFSLGMSSMSPGDDMGDVFDSGPVRPKLPISPPVLSPRRTSHELENISENRLEEDGGMLGRWSSRGSRADSGSIRSGSRKNVFFRNKSKLSQEDKTVRLDDLEAVVVDNSQRTSETEAVDEKSGAPSSMKGT
ncbi:Mechanosensitive ion channel-domain-containing protein [Xylogone sp. PMI_703]|nr:Mechanosensitive ion channel-domain-containing protein [Xylogone sp. PMI_703]